MYPFGRRPAAAGESNTSRELNECTTNQGCVTGEGSRRITGISTRHTVPGTDTGDTVTTGVGASHGAAYTAQRKAVTGEHVNIVKFRRVAPVVLAAVTAGCCATGCTAGDTPAPGTAGDVTGGGIGVAITVTNVDRLVNQGRIIAADLLHSYFDDRQVPVPGQRLRAGVLVSAAAAGNGWLWTVTTSSGDSCVHVYSQTRSWLVAPSSCVSDGTAPAWAAPAARRPPDPSARTVTAALLLARQWVGPGGVLPDFVTDRPVPGVPRSRVSDVLAAAESPSAVFARVDVPAGCLVLAAARPGQPTGTVFAGPGQRCRTIPSAVSPVGPFI